jgi:hypothetical protein
MICKIGIALAGMRAIAAALLALAAVVPAAAVAQVVTGTVRDETGAPVHGALVRLVDDRGGHAGGVLTNTLGHFRIQAPAPGTWRLNAQRIGMATVATAAFELADGATETRNVELRSSPIELEGVVAWGRQQCDMRPGEGTALWALWDEARKAFEVVAHTRDAELYRFRTRRYERELEPGSAVVLSDRSRSRVGYSSGSPFVALPAEDLLRDGFVQPERDGSVMFYLPDVDVLLSDGFQEAHCFRLVRGPDDATVGIGITPAGRRDGLRGTLWLDRATHEVRRLDFALSERSLRSRGMPAADGALDFEALPSGAWLVRRWSVRMPLMVDRVVRWGGGTRSEWVVHRIREEGGEVTEVGGSMAGEAFRRSETAALTGRVYDEDVGSPLPGAVVRIEGTEHSVRSDDDGRFSIPDLPAGRYAVTFRHPTLDRYGLAAEPVTLDLVPGDAAPLDLVVERGFREARLRERCAAVDPEAAGHGEAGVIVGEARDARSGEPLRNALVQVYWDTFARDVAFWRYRDGLVLRTGGDGSFLACGVPVDRAVRIEVEGAARSAGGRETVVRLQELGLPYTFVTIRTTPARAPRP